MPTRSLPPAATEVTPMNALTQLEAETSIALGAPVDVTIDAVAKDFGDSPALFGVSLDVRAASWWHCSARPARARRRCCASSPGSRRRLRPCLFGGEDALGLPVQDRNIGFVFQHYALFRHMTVFDNIAFGLTVRPARLPAAQVEIRRACCISSISSSSRAREALSDAALWRPAAARGARPARSPSNRDCCCSTNPSARSDAQVRKDLRRWLREIHDRTGHTTFFVTPRPEEALELADRVVVMSKGGSSRSAPPSTSMTGRPAPSSFPSSANRRCCRW